MRDNKKVSIIMPLFNDAAYVEAAIGSVLAQSYTDWELIIVDDGSSDGSYEAARAFESDRIKVITQKNSGACVARDRALRESSGAFVKFLDADDLLDKDCLSVQIAQIEGLGENEIPFGDYNFINPEGQVIHEHKFSWQEELEANQELFFYSHWEVLITTPLHRRELLEAVGFFDEKLPRGQEYDLHFRLANSGCRFVYCPAITFSYRKHDSIYRISTGTKARNYETSAYLAYTYQKFEDLLVAKYGELPYEFRPGLFKFWFARSRAAFAARNKEDGKHCLANARRVLCWKNRFFRVYSVVGRVIGYVPLESLLRLRLKLIGKNKTGQAENLGRFI